MITQMEKISRLLLTHTSPAPQRARTNHDETPARRRAAAHEVFRRPRPRLTPRGASRAHARPLRTFAKRRGRPLERVDGGAASTLRHARASRRRPDPLSPRRRLGRAMSRCDLLSLQGKCKRDPEGYRDDVLMQLQHYNALHGLFMLKPGKDFKEFADLVGFLAQVAASYKRDIPAFHVGLIELLDKHYALLDPNLRRSLVGALILLHNRGSVTLGELLPLFFRLFRCPDKQLRLMIFRHIVAAVKSANKNKRDDRLNRSVQNFLQAALKDENEAAAKKALAVITDLYRRNVWSDARTVNLAADACRHPSPKILVAALKFFLGQDEAAEAAAAEGDEDSDDEGENKPKMGEGTKAGTSSGVSKEDVYRAYNKGATVEGSKDRTPPDPTPFFFLQTGFGAFPRSGRARRLGSRRDVRLVVRGGR